MVTARDVDRIHALAGRYMAAGPRARVLMSRGVGAATGFFRDKSGKVHPISGGGAGQGSLFPSLAPAAPTQGRLFGGTPAPMPGQAAAAPTAPAEPHHIEQIHRAARDLHEQAADAAADYKQNGTRAKAFKAWFGEWEHDPANASKVVNEKGEPQETHNIPGEGSQVMRDGKPVAVYHGTARGGFDSFDKSKQSPGSLYGPGFYFTEDEGIAGEYQEKDRPHRLTREVTDADMKRAGKWFNSAATGRLMKEDVGIRESVRESYNAWKGGAEHFTTHLQGDESHSGSLRKLLGIDRVAEGTPEVKALFLNIRRPFHVDEPMSKMTDAEFSGIGRAMNEYVDSGKWKPIGDDWGQKAGTDVEGTKARLQKLLSEYRGSAATPEDLLARVTNQISGRFGKAQWQPFLQAAGFDGITHVGGNRMGGGHEHRVWIAFEPHQIKAVANRGTFDPADHDIRMGRAPLQ